MEWFIIILLIIFVIMIVTLPVYDTQKVITNKNTTFADTYKESKDLVMLPNPNPASLTTHITV